MARTVSIAAIQTLAHDRAAFTQKWPDIARLVREASAQSDLVVLPEGTLPGYVLGYEPYDEREIASAVDECRALAREHHSVIVAGAARSDGTRIFNSAMVIDADGTIAGRSDKHFLWHFDRQWFARGECIEPIATTLGPIGALICADGRIPTIARALVDRGAQLLVMPTAWVTSGRDPSHLENVQADLLARVRARENDVPFAAANKCGVELRCVAYCGKSQIVHADGSIAAMASQDRPEILFAKVELRKPQPTRIPAKDTFERAEPFQPVRIAVTARDDEIPADLLRIIEAQSIVSPAFDERSGAIAGVAAHAVGDREVADPGYLAHARLQGCALAVWHAETDPDRQVTFARARALELKMYLVTIDRSRGRAFATDPDGNVICGTYGDYEIAAFTYDPQRTAQTLVAPGTDVRQGLERAALHAGS